MLPLRSVSQQNTLFTSLDQAKLVHVDSVYRLDLSKQKLTVFPIEILNFRNLKELYLGKNKISQLPSNFKSLKQLEVLDLSKNAFSKFPIPLCSMSNIKQLFLGRNQITSFPECIGQMVGLEVLDIWYNQIDSLPNTITNLKNLKSLDLRGVNFSRETQVYIQGLIPWCKIEFDLGCDCAH